MIQAAFQEKFTAEEQNPTTAEGDKIKVAFRFQNSKKVEFNFVATEPTQVHM